MAYYNDINNIILIYYYIGTVINHIQQNLLHWIDDILLVKGAAIEASPNLTITDCSSSSSNNFCILALVLAETRGLFLGPFVTAEFEMCSFFTLPCFSVDVLSGKLDKIATPEWIKN